MLASLARGSRLSLDERDHLFRLGGYATPGRVRRTDHVDVGITRILDRLPDSPAMVVTRSVETLLQTPPAVALLDDEMVNEGLARSVAYRWYADPSSRDRYPVEDQAGHGRSFTSDLRTAYARDGAASFAAQVVEALSVQSEEFRSVWSEHDSSRRRSHLKRIIHTEVGLIEVYCQTLFDLDQDQGLLVFTAAPRTASHEKLRLLSVIGAQSLRYDPTSSLCQIHVVP